MLIDFYFFYVTYLNIFYTESFANSTGKHLCWNLFFYKVSSLQACSNTKKILLHRCFPVKFKKF